MVRLCRICSETRLWSNGICHQANAATSTPCILRSAWPTARPQLKWQEHLVFTLCTTANGQMFWHFANHLRTVFAGSATNSRRRSDLSKVLHRMRMRATRSCDTLRLRLQTERFTGEDELVPELTSTFSALLLTAWTRASGRCPDGVALPRVPTGWSDPFCKYRHALYMALERLFLCPTKLWPKEVIIHANASWLQSTLLIRFVNEKACPSGNLKHHLGLTHHSNPQFEHV